MGIIEVDLFDKDIDSPDHPEVKKFRELLEEVAAEYRSSLTYFEIKQGTVSFSFDDDALTARVVKILEEKE